MPRPDVSLVIPIYNEEEVLPQLDKRLSRMLDVLAVSSGTNHAVETKIPNYVLRNVPIGFSLDLSYKDVRLCVEAGEALDLPMHMGRMTQQIWQDAINRGGPKQDYLQVVKLFEDWAGVQWTGDPVALAQ